MRLSDYFRSLSAECHALKDRVGHFIDDAHWLTVGEGKESILRTLLGRNLPDTVRVGRGFVVSHEHVSTQIDVLLYDASHPVLYRDGDLVFIAPAACRGVIEVKTSLTIPQLQEACEKLSKVAKAVRRSQKRDIFVGIFSYKADFGSQSHKQALEVIGDASSGQLSRIINHVALGDSLFAKFWKFDPTCPPVLKRRLGFRLPDYAEGDYRHWHLYKMRDMAFGYFIHNALVGMAPHLSIEEENVYFPESGKELMGIHRVPFVLRKAVQMAR